MSHIIKIISTLFIVLFAVNSALASTTNDFNEWLNSYKKFAYKQGISQTTLDITFKNVKFLEQVIKYDRKQPEFFEDTLTYVGKRATISRSKSKKSTKKK